MSTTPGRRAARFPLALLGAAAIVAGCAATSPTATPAAGVASAGSAAAAAPAASSASGAAGAKPATPPGAPQPFAEVTKGARRVDGYFPVWTQDEKTWLEIPADRLGQPFFFATSLASGLGERSFWPGLMTGDQVAVLRRVGNHVQFVALNFHARAPEGTPLARAVGESYSESLIASAPLAAAPHAESKALLVDASALLGGDITGMQTRLEFAYRLPYSLDRTNSSIEHTRTGPEGTSLTLRQHYAIPRLPAPPVLLPGLPPPNPAMLPNPPTGVPDPRSLFLGLTYTLAPLPAQPMHARRADQRVGYFTDRYIDFGDDNGGDRRTHLINRWRLEKKDPAAAVSEPRQPIRVVMDRNIPEKWRAPVRDGILEWNKAFERAGWRNAIVVEQQAADADWSSLEGAHVLAVRWFAVDGPGATAVGPRQSDPRTGEILRGAAIIPENWARLDRRYLGDTEPRLPPPPAAAEQCSYADSALEQAAFAFELLDARGLLDPHGPSGERFIAQSLKAVTMHEVGHALGLRHNFRASSGITRAELRDPRFTAERGISNSVMDYIALNLPLEGEAVTSYHMDTLGAYDYWAIEYGYRDFPPDQEAQSLVRIAGRADGDPALAYATDEDLAANDPMVNAFDLGNDPLDFAERQIKLSRELWTRTEKRTLEPDDDMTVYRRNLVRGLNGMAAAVPLAAKVIGGVFTARASAGANKPLITPVPAARQRAALKMLVDEVFASRSFRFEPRFMSRLAVDQFDRTGPNRFIGSTDFSLPGAVIGIQRSALDVLMSESLASRLADAEAKVDDPRSLLAYAEVQTRLTAAVWSELKAKGGAREIDSLRRNLQREHLKRLVGGLLRPSGTAGADMTAAHRQSALALQGMLKAALAGGGWTPVAQAHLAESLAAIDEALKAPLVKQGV